ncbi:phenylpropionate dioxygenase-like ring-hydroxylating dioxygenase large terminal subunit [Actinocorallia herbida]|uniref:Phenylpropionate dioxygenase-like ring-hydroxylating dioxygenase large terminal subunit n=1 Tax=Actinocorallia herbida TaxID=58109 RepID=A0A3N1CY48_9ACTN|nr:aromatic ring-hydroxylating dioxygenase subunit alpha [Actinocorallia herbida]ROO86227.1 phenylpropionate dioxygenase-like ring-hydroxylating dioxygenase large terminal subunit [Actinocorallia herbida]
MDREALERGLVRRLLDHIAHRTTDLTDAVLELPADIYSAERHLEEAEVLFRDQPLVLCLSGALPEPGSFRTVDLLGTPVLLTRDNDGQVHALLNACRHRGVRVADGAGEAVRLTCPFHAWTYNLKGDLLRMPSASSFEGMCKEDKGLIELPVAEGHGLIIGRLRPGPLPEVEEFLGPGLADELAMLDFGTWLPHGEPHVHPVRANWKVTLDTFRENYHFDYLHRKTLATYAYGGVLTFDPFGRHLRNCSALRSIDALKDVPEEEWGDVGQHFSYQYALFPNTSLTLDARHAELWQIVPVDEATSEVVHTSYFRPDLGEAELAKAAEMAPWICETVVDGEDFWVAGRTEPGVRAGLLDTVVFGRNEPAPQHLHRGFEDALREAREGR